MRIRSVILLTLTVLAGCAGMLPKVNAAALPDGLYQFSEHAAGTSGVFTGMLQIAGDSVVVVAAAPFCTQVSHTEPRTVSYACDEYGLFGDHTSGQWKFTYNTGRAVRTQHDECAEYRTVDGAQRCVRMVTKTEEHVVPVREALHLAPLDTLLPRRQAP